MHCFLTFRKEEGGESTALLFHHMARYPSRLGENSPFAGSWYVTGGQPVGGVHITYDVPLDMFGVTSPMQAYTVDRTQRELANDITIKTLIPEPTTENVVDIELISTRRSMWIPNQYAALCVEEDMTPVDIYSRVHAALLQDGVAMECQPLVDFLRAQLVGAHHTNAAIYLESELTQPRSVTSLIRHRNLILRSLSSSFPSVPTSQPSVQGMTIQDLKAFMEVVRDGQSNESKSQRQPSIPVSSVDKKWKVNLQSLLKFSQVTKTTALAPIWFALGDGTKKEERIILQAALDDFSLSPSAATNAKKLLVDKSL